eukprot:TRINITY_DN11779_c0_g2_i1.p1 TRINITY_DN11779_c0_g2~~TRINITY_DN11779_c0_g2_i1.p1  ORF type:complete len:485 (+),score=82.90 TRINITY_DN11779_c0_g2_i1:523-1977(+)
MPFEFLQHFREFSFLKGSGNPRQMPGEYAALSTQMLILGRKGSEKTFRESTLHAPNQTFSVNPLTKQEMLLNLRNLQILKSPKKRGLQKGKAGAKQDNVDSEKGDFWLPLRSLKSNVLDFNRNRRQRAKKRRPLPERDGPWYLFPPIPKESKEEKFLQAFPRKALCKGKEATRIGFWENVLKFGNRLLKKSGVSERQGTPERTLISRPFLFNFGDLVLQRIEKEIEAERIRKKAARRENELIKVLHNFQQMIQKSDNAECFSARSEKDSNMFGKLKGTRIFFVSKIDTASVRKENSRSSTAYILFASQILKVMFDHSPLRWYDKSKKGPSSGMLEAPDSDIEIPAFTPYMAKIPWHTGPRAFLSRLFPRYGNYCGPNWSSGKEGGGPLWDKKPVDWLDYCCYCHDMGYDSYDQAELLQADLAFLDCLERRKTSKKRTKRFMDATEAYRTMCITGLRNVLIPYRKFLVQQIESKRMAKADLEGYN